MFELLAVLRFVVVQDLDVSGCVYDRIFSGLDGGRFAVHDRSRVPN